jgi:hypothetical protein
MIAKSMVSDGGMKLRALAREAMSPVAVLSVSGKAEGERADPGPPRRSLVSAEAFAGHLRMKCAETTTDCYCQTVFPGSDVLLRLLLSLLVRHFLASFNRAQ